MDTGTSANADESRDAASRMGLQKLKRATWRKQVPFQGLFIVHRLGQPTINICTKFEVSVFTHYEDKKAMKNVNIELVWGGGEVGVTQGHR